MDIPMEEKCENLMNVVVETRKQFGKMCMDYEQKAAMMEHKILKLKTENLLNYKFKSKTLIPRYNVEEAKKELDDFAKEILARRARFDNLKNKVKESKAIAQQIHEDDIEEKVHQPCTAEALLTRAKAKLAQKNQENCE